MKKKKKIREKRNKKILTKSILRLKNEKWKKWNNTNIVYHEDLMVEVRVIEISQNYFILSFQFL